MRNSENFALGVPKTHVCINFFTPLQCDNKNKISPPVMAQLNITQSAKLIGISKRTLQRKIKSGEVSYSTNEQGHRLIDTSELLRVFKRLSPPEVENVSPVFTPPVSPPNNEDSKKLDDLADKLLSALNKIDALTNEISELKAHVMRLEYKETSEYLSQNTDKTLDALNESVDQDTKSETAPKDSLSIDDIPSFLDL